MTISELAREASSWFERDTRTDGTTYVKTKDGRPEWLQELIHEAHGDFLPDDWRYACIEAALDYIADNDLDEEDELNDRCSEFADSHTDVYNGRLVEWLASSLYRSAYVDEAVSDFGHDEERGIYGAIALGQYREAEEVYGSVVQSLKERVEELDEQEVEA